MPIQINLTNQLLNLSLNKQQLCTLIEQAVNLSGLTYDHYDNPALDIHFLNAKEMTSLNETFLQHEGPTDVITFQYKQDDFPDGSIEQTIGEIFVCSDIAKNSAESIGCTESEELVYYIIHGILHLAGYDDHNEDDIRQMRQAEQKILDSLRKDFDLTMQCNIKEST